MSSLKTFDPKDVVITFGTGIITGFADGTFVNVERDEDTFSSSVGADGEPLRVKSNNKMSTVTLTLQQSSDSNTFLSAIAQLDERLNSGVVPITVKEINGDTIVTGGRAYIVKPATIEYSKEASTREWTIKISESEVFVGGNVVSGILGIS